MTGKQLGASTDNIEDKSIQGKGLAILKVVFGIVLLLFWLERALLGVILQESNLSLGPTELIALAGFSAFFLGFVFWGINQTGRGGQGDNISFWLRLIQVVFMASLVSAVVQILLATLFAEQNAGIAVFSLLKTGGGIYGLYISQSLLRTMRAHD